MRTELYAAKGPGVPSGDRLGLQAGLQQQHSVIVRRADVVSPLPAGDWHELQAGLQQQHSIRDVVYPLPAGDWHELQAGLQQQHSVPYPFSIQHCEKSRAVVMVLSDGSCALLGVPSAGEACMSTA
eukprot:1159807-Pelagomonas_calceolata.AAC.5